MHLNGSIPGWCCQPQSGLFETHDLWVKAADCQLLLDDIRNPAFGALWDMGHTSVQAEKNLPKPIKRW